MSECKVIAVANQKGGVGKTTTTFNLGVALAKKGKKVLLVDVDSQANLTTYAGWNEPEELPMTLSHLMQQVVNDEDIKVKDTILHHKENVDLIPSDIGLATLEIALVNVMSREYTLSNCLLDIKKDYDYIILDCMPSLGMITVNALASADSVIIPVQSQFFAAKGLTQLLKTINRIKKQINPKLEIEGILFTLVDNRTNLSREIESQIREECDKKIKIFKTNIPRAVKIAESTSLGNSIFSHAQNSKVAEAYAELAKEVEYDRTKQKETIAKYR